MIGSDYSRHFQDWSSANHNVWHRGLDGILTWLQGTRSLGWRLPERDILKRPTFAVRPRQTNATHCAARSTIEWNMKLEINQSELNLQEVEPEYVDTVMGDIVATIVDPQGPIN